jgi:small subunit ribosomal protein S20
MKSMRQTKKRTARNDKVKENIAYLRRMFRQSMESKDVKECTDLAQKLIKSVDKAVQNNVMKLNTGSRMKSRLMAQLNALIKAKK